MSAWERAIDPPWSACLDDLNPYYWLVKDSNGAEILDFPIAHGGEEVCRLIAAAPDLLEALTKVIESGVTLGGHHRALAVAAIAKAEGRS